MPHYKFRINELECRQSMPLTLMKPWRGPVSQKIVLMVCLKGINSTRSLRCPLFCLGHEKIGPVKVNAVKIPYIFNPIRERVQQD
jgi:hypothetical protein